MIYQIYFFIIGCQYGFKFFKTNFAIGFENFILCIEVKNLLLIGNNLNAAAQKTPIVGNNSSGNSENNLKIIKAHRNSLLL